MQKIIFIVIAVLMLSSNCVSTEKPAPAEYFTLFNDAQLLSGPLGYHMIAPGEKALALQSGKLYSRKMVCEFSLQSAPVDGARNGFLVLYNSNDPESMIFAGVYIGGSEYSIHGPGVTKPIFVQIDFDQDQVFHFTVLVNFEKGYIELSTPGRTIGTGLAPEVKQVDTIGYSANNTEVYFSAVKIEGESTTTPKEGGLPAAPGSLPQGARLRGATRKSPTGLLNLLSTLGQTALRQSLTVTTCTAGGFFR